MLAPDEKFAWLRLIRSEAVGPVTFWALLERFGTAQRAVEALPRLAQRAAAKRPIALASEATCRAEAALGEAIGARLVAFGEADYPAHLARLDPAPPLLWIKGNRGVLQKPCVAVVGARNASALGRKFASDIALELGKAGFSVASGLARGIDAAAHAGSLSTGTIAAMAGGVDQIWPPENGKLAEDLQQFGCLLSEMPLSLEPQARHFPRRNRLIAGLSLGVVVVEAALHSGSLITARYAVEANREVFAVPGSPLDPRARGSNDLIRQGAILTEGIDDILQVLAPSLAAPARPLAPPPPPLVAMDADGDPKLQRQLAALLGPAPTDIDELVRQTGAPAAAVAAALLELELAGHLTRHPGRQVSQA
jgi:DNA processing protein